jgi:hypothetical protein
MQHETAYSNLDKVLVNAHHPSIGIVTLLHDKLAHDQCATETDAPLSCREAPSLQNSEPQLHFQQTQNVARQAAAEVRSEAAKLLRQV